jgi:chromosomal replication initiator protein
MPASESSGSKDVAVAVQDVLKAKLGEDRFSLYFPPVFRFVAEKDSFCVITGSRFALERVQKRMLDMLREVVQHVYQRPVPVRLRVAAETAEIAPEQGSPSKTVAGPVRLNAQPPKRPKRNQPEPRAAGDGPRLLIASEATAVRRNGGQQVASPRADQSQYESRTELPHGESRGGELGGTSLSNFCVGDCNQLAFTAARMVAEQPGAASPLFFWGPAGCGKTHLLAALKNELRSKHHLRRVVMLSAEQFTNDFTGAVRGSGLPGFRRRYRDVDALLIDDVQFVGGKKATLRELLYTVDSLMRGRCQLAFTGDRPPLELDGLNEELSGRLAGGMVCPLRPLDRATRLKMLQGLATRQPCPLDPTVLERLAEELAGDGRILTGAMNHLRALSQMLGRAVQWDELSASAPDLIAAGRPTVNLSDIQRAVCDMFGLPQDSLRARGQQRAVSQPRMLAMYLARQYTRAAFSEIGEFFGNRSHSTVIAATKRVEDWLAESTPVRRGPQSLGPRQAIEAIENLLRTG